MSKRSGGFQLLNCNDKFYSIFERFKVLDRSAPTRARAEMRHPEAGRVALGRAMRVLPGLSSALAMALLTLVASLVLSGSALAQCAQLGESYLGTSGDCANKLVITQDDFYAAGSLQIGGDKTYTAKDQNGNVYDVSKWYTGNIDNMSYYFHDFSGELPNIQNWNTSKVTNMSGMFASTRNFNQSLNDWDTSNVKNMQEMFSSALSFNGDISDWDVGNVTDMESMFYYATAFNGDISGWEPLKVTTMKGMFEEASAFNGDISGWDVGNVTSMENMFREASAFNGDISGWEPLKVTTMKGMFREAYAFNSDISGWDVNQVTDMEGMFRGASAFNSDISGWDVSSVTNMYGMFYEADSFNRSLNSWTTGQVTDMRHMFHGTGTFNGDISNWDFSGPPNMEGMFFNASAFDGDISGWDVSNVLNMAYMFKKTGAFDGDIGGWDVSNVTNMDGMFQDSSAFDQDLSGWDVGDNFDKKPTNFNSGANTNWVDNPLLQPRWSPPVIESYSPSLGATNVARDANLTLTFDEDVQAGSGHITVSDLSSNSNTFATINVPGESVTFEGATVTINLESDFAWNSIYAITIEEGAILNTDDTGTAFAGISDTGTWQFTTAGPEISADLSTVTAEQRTLGVGDSATIKVEVKDASGAAVAGIASQISGKIDFNGTTGGFGGFSEDADTPGQYSAEFGSSLAGEAEVTITVAEVELNEKATVVFEDRSNCTVESTSYLGKSEPCKDLLVITQADFDAAGSSQRGGDGSFIAKDESGNEYPADKWYTGHITDMSQMFREADTFNEDISGWDVNQVTDMEGMFRGASAFNSDISGWDVSSVTNMYGMFYEADSFNRSLNSWTTGQVTDMRHMFHGTGTFNGDISNWDFSGPPNMEGMFFNASAFDGDISDWDVSNVLNMAYMFKKTGAFDGDISDWDVSNVQNMDGMFQESSAFDQDLSGWDVGDNFDKKPTNFNSGANTNWVDNPLLQPRWSPPVIETYSPSQGANDVALNTTLSLTFDEAVKAGSGSIEILDLDSSTVFAALAVDGEHVTFSDTEVTITPPSILEGQRDYAVEINDGVILNTDDTGTAFSGIGISDTDQWQFTTVASTCDDIGESYLGQSGDCAGKLVITQDDFDAAGSSWRGGNDSFIAKDESGNEYGVDKWYTGHITDMSYMFFGADTFNGDISGWDVSNVTNMSTMFYSADAFNGDISGWNVENVTNMKDMFRGAGVFNGDISNWEVGKVTDMAHMFRAAHAFNADISDWDVFNVTDMQYMFYGTDVFNADISGWKVDNVENMKAMFGEAYAFNADIGGWEVVNVTDMSEMFVNGSPSRDSVFNQDLSGWDVSYFTKKPDKFNTGAKTDWVNDPLLQPRWSPPVIEAYSPSQGAPDVALNTTLSLTFDEAVKAGSGSIEILDLDSSTVFATLAVDGEHVTFSDTEVTITPPSFLEGQRDYAVEINDGVILNTDDTGTAFSGIGISDTDQWQFTTVASTCDDIGESYLGQSGDCAGKLVITQDDFDAAGSSWRGGNDSFIAKDESGNEYGVDKWYTGHITDMSYMFFGADTFNGDISGWDVSNVTNMSTMFYSADAFNGDISGWNVENVTNMKDMFRGAGVFNGDISNWEVGKVTDMAHMFRAAHAFNADISDWDVFNVTDMQYMFYGTDVFNADISGWKVNNVENMKAMFGEAYAFNADIGGWEVVNVTDMSEMFVNGSPSRDSVFNQDLSGWDVSYFTKKPDKFNTGAKTDWVNDPLLQPRWSPPVIEAYSPSQGAPDVAPNATLSLTFDEAVMPGSGSIEIFDLDRSTSFATLAVDGDRVTFSNTEVKITLPSVLEWERGYAITIDEGAILNTDDTGTAFAGISDTGTWQFTTADPDVSAVNSTVIADPDLLGVGEETILWVTVKNSADEAVPYLEDQISAEVNFDGTKSDLGGFEEDATTPGQYSTTFVSTSAGTAEVTVTVAEVELDQKATVTFATTPDAPTNLLATPDDEQKLTLTWTAPSDGGSEILYHEYKVDDGGYVSTNSSATNVSFEVENGVAYKVRVRAVNDFGAGQVSDTATVPFVTLTTNAADVVSEAFTVDVTFSNPVTCFKLGQVGDIVVTNGTVTDFQPLNVTCNEDYEANYSFQVTPKIERDGDVVKVDIPAAVATSEDGHSNTAALTLAQMVDTTGPTLTLSSQAESLVSGAFTVSAVFSEDVTGFVAGDVDVDNGSVDNFQGSGASYSFDVTPSSEGDVTVEVADDVAQDLAGNGNATAAQLVRTADFTVPTLELVSLSDQVVGGQFSVSVTFSETVTGFDAGDVEVDNGSVDNFQGSEAAYSFDVTPISDGEVTVDVAAGAAVDSAGNGNAAATQLSRTADFAAPTVTLQTSVPEPIGEPFSVTAEFSEEVSDFALDDLILTNAVGDNLVGSGSVYTFDVTPAATGEMTIAVAENAVQDRVGNGNEASAQLSLTADLTSPSLSLATTASSPVGTVFSVSATFSEDVTGFESSHVQVDNGNVYNFQGSGSDYSFDVRPTSDGEVKVNVVADVATDSAGNGNTAATQLSRTADLTAPTVALGTLAGDPVRGQFSVTVTFSESVTGFSAGDVQVANGDLGNFQGSGTDYSFDVTPISDGDVTVNVAADVAADSAGNGNAAATQLSRTADLTSPGLSLSTSAGDPVGGTFTVTATFTEAVTGFDLGDIGVVNAAADNLQGSGTGYSFDVRPISDGEVRVNVAAGVAVDSAGNGNAAAAQLSRTADLTAPTVGLATDADLVGGTFTVTATFSEAVTGFELGDIEVGNGGAANFSGSEQTYSFEVTPSANGTVTVDVAAGVGSDAAGNGNTAALRLTVTADLRAPTVVLDTGAGDFVSGTFTVTATFSEAVTGFDAGDVVVTNASLDQFTGSGASYSFDVTPISDGVVTVDVAAGAAQDGAGNATAAAAQLTRTADLTVPTVTLQTSSPEPVGGTFSVTAEFSEEVSDFALDDLILTNAVGTNLVGSGSVYTFDVTPAATGTVTILVAEEGVQDRAGNGNEASDQLSVTADLTSPTVSLATSATSPVGTTFSVSATFSEDVTDFDSSDVEVINGSLGNFSGSGRNYSFDITPQGNGEVTVDVGAGVAQDAAGNGNAAATPLSLTADLDGSTLGLSTTASNPVAGEFTVTATFGESVTGFELNDIVVGNGIADNFQGTGSDYSFDVTPASDGDVTVDVAAGVAFDSAGNGNAAAAQLSRTADMTAPTVSLTTLADGPFSGIFNVTVEFSEPVTGFGLSDVVVGNGTLSNLLGSGASYTFNVTPLATGNVTLDVVAGVAFDSAGNSNVAAVQLVREADLTVPTVGLAKLVSGDVVGGVFTVRATFSEAVTGFESGDIGVVNGTVSNFVEVSSLEYDFDVTPASTGEVRVDVAADVAVDSAGNSNTAASTLSVMADLISPTVSLATSATSPVGTTFSVSATFSEDVTDFDSSDVEVGNGSVGNFSGSGQNYSFDVTPTSNGEVTVDVGAGVAQDAAGNGNAAATPLSLTVDLDGSTLGLSTTAGNPVAGEFTVTATFSESVTGFELNDIVVGNGTADSFSGSGASYSFDVTPTSDGDVTVDVAAGVAFDSAGNGNAAAAQLSRTADMTGPTFDEGDYNFNWPENDSGTIATVVATDTNGPLTYSLTGGADAGIFSLTEGGALSFGADGSDSADYENPDDANQDNIYELQVTAWDGVSPANGTVQDVTVTVTNVVDEEDTKPIGVAPTGGSDIVLSSDGTALTLAEGTYEEVEVSLIEAPADAVTILVSSRDTAVAKVSREQDGQQFDEISLTFELANWETPQSFWIAAVDRPQELADFDATINMSFANSADAGYQELSDLSFDVEVTNATEPEILVSDAGDVLEIREGEGKYFKVALTAQPTGDVQVSVDPADPSIATVDWGTREYLKFTTENWDAGINVLVLGVDRPSTLQEGRTTLTLEATGGGYGQGDSATTAAKEVLVPNTTAPKISVSSGDLTFAEGEIGTFEVWLSVAPLAEFTLDLASQDTTVATLAEGSSPLTFNHDNWQDIQTVTVEGVSVENDLNTLGTTINIVANDSKNASGFNGVSNEKTVSVTNTTVPKINVSSGDLTFAEGETGTFEVWVSAAPLAEFTLELTSGDTTVATLAEESSQLTFNQDNWQDSQTVTVKGVLVEDDLNTLEATIDIVADDMTNTAGFKDVSNTKTVSVTNATVPEILVSDAGDVLEIREGEGSVFTVALTAQPTADVQVSVVSGDPSVATADWGTGPDEFLTFTAENWGTEQVVTVKGVDRASTLLDGTATLTLIATGGGYGQGDSATTAEKDVSVTNTTEPEILVSDAGEALEIREDGDGRGIALES